MHSVLALLAAASLGAAPAWETLSEPALGVEVLKPTAWTAEALAQDGLLVKAPAPLQGSVAFFPVSAPGGEPRGLVTALSGRLGATVTKESPLPDGYAAQVQYADAATPGVPRTAVIAAVLSSGRGVLVVLSAPSSEWDAARPALGAIAASFRQRSPLPAASAVPAEVANQRFEPFRELKEEAFVGELPGDWKKDLSVAIVEGTQPYVRASVVGRSPDNLYAFVHYKIASFQAPEREAKPTAKERPYLPGVEVLEKYLFPAVARRGGDTFAEWKITRRGGAKPLFTHPSGVRFDGEEVEYTYRYKGEQYAGQAFVTTYLLPGPVTTTWFLYGLHGFEAPVGREAAARSASVRLLRSFRFEGRYAPQGDLFWTLARDAALRFLASSTSAAGPAALTSVVRRATPAPMSAVENAVQGLTSLTDVLGRPVQFGSAAALGGTAEIPVDLAELRSQP
jgi:hypothetical protein